MAGKGNEGEGAAARGAIPSERTRVIAEDDMEELAADSMEDDAPVHTRVLADGDVEELSAADVRRLARGEISPAELKAAASPQTGEREMPQASERAPDPDARVHLSEERLAALNRGPLDSAPPSIESDAVEPDALESDAQQAARIASADVTLSSDAMARLARGPLDSDVPLPAAPRVPAAPLDGPASGASTGRVSLSADAMAALDRELVKSEPPSVMQNEFTGDASGGRPSPAAQTIPPPRRARGTSPGSQVKRRAAEPPDEASDLGVVGDADDDYMPDGGTVPNFVNPADSARLTALEHGLASVEALLAAGQLGAALAVVRGLMNK